MSKMNPEIKARWVAALRSGEYKQGRKYLRSADEEFCCLGVLCDLAAKDGVTQWERLRDECFGQPSSEGSYSSLMPPVTSEWAGFAEYHGFGARVGIDGAVTDLAGHNDQGRTFAEIADAIEKQL